MNRLLVTAAAFALIGAPAAFAQQQGDQSRHWDGGGRGGGQDQGRGQGGQSSQGQGRQAPAPQSQGRQGGQGNQPGGRPDWNAYYRNNPDLQREYRRNQLSPQYQESQQAYAERHYREHGQAEGRNLPTTSYGGQQQGGQWRGGAWQGDRGGDYRNGQARDGWRGDRSGDNRNWQGDRGGRQDFGSDRYRSYERNTWAQHRYRLGGYQWPRGWGYRRWSYGEFLPSVFFNQDYFLYDYSDYGLPYPPPGCEWVRYGPDALLIDRDTGEIVQVVYGIFY